MDKTHFASSALSMENGSQLSVPTPKWEEGEENCWRMGRTKNIGLDASSPFVLSPLARAVTTWGLQILGLSLRVRAWVAASGPGRCFLGDLSSLPE